MFSLGLGGRFLGRGDLEEDLGQVHDLDVGSALLGALRQVEHAERAAGDQDLGSGGLGVVDPLHCDGGGEVVELALVASSCTAAPGVLPGPLHLDELDALDLLDDVPGSVEDAHVPSEVAGVVVGDLVVELVVQRELPVVDQLFDVLGEVVDVLSDLGVESAEVRADGLVASGAGHDHVLRTHSVGLLDDGLGASEGLVEVPGPDERGRAAPLFVTEAVHLDSGPVEDPDSGLGDVLHSVGSGAPGEEDHIGDLGALDIGGPPGIPLGGVLPVGVVELVDALAHVLVGGEGSFAVLDDPGPHVLPEVDQVDLGVADDLAVPAPGALVHGIDELGAEGDLSAEKAVEGSGADLVQLVDVVDLSPGGDGLPRSLVVGLADIDAVSTLQAGCENFLDTGEFDELRLLDVDLYHETISVRRFRHRPFCYSRKSVPI